MNKKNKKSNDSNNSLFSFYGRIRRRKFWDVIVSLLIFGFVLELTALQNLGPFVAGGAAAGVIGLGLVIFIPVIWCIFATNVKRWHDLNMSGWMVLTLFIPYVNLLVLLYLGIAPGTIGTNKYG
jgi:uncharacterized membrane protein YhaH (DUF805 family)